MICNVMIVLSHGEVSFPLYLQVILYYAVTLQRTRFIVGDAGFESRMSVSEVGCATNKPPRLLMSSFRSCMYEVFCFVNGRYGVPTSGAVGDPGSGSGEGTVQVQTKCSGLC